MVCRASTENTVLSFILMLQQDYFVNICSDTHVSQVAMAQMSQVSTVDISLSQVTPEGVTFEMDFHM